MILYYRMLQLSDLLVDPIHYTIYNETIQYYRKQRIMKLRIKILLVLLCITIAGPAWAGWSDYQPTTLADITSKHSKYFSKRKVPKGTLAINLHAGGDPFRSTVLFLGKIRNIKSERLSMIELWGKSSGINIATGNFKKEIKVSENRRTYWLPIQEILVPHLKREVKINGEVILFMVYIGTKGENPVFLVNEFRAF